VVQRKGSLWAPGAWPIWGHRGCTRGPRRAQRRGLRWGSDGCPGGHRVGPRVVLMGAQGGPNGGLVVGPREWHSGTENGGRWGPGGGPGGAENGVLMVATAGTVSLGAQGWLTGGQAFPNVVGSRGGSQSEARVGHRGGPGGSHWCPGESRVGPNGWLGWARRGWPRAGSTWWAEVVSGVGHGGTGGAEGGQNRGLEVVASREANGGTGCVMVSPGGAKGGGSGRLRVLGPRGGQEAQGVLKSGGSWGPRG
jgi:hypothetical protein